MAKRLTASGDGAEGLASWISGLTIGPPQRVGELTLVPLSHDRVPSFYLSFRVWTPGPHRGFAATV